jgi:hypothetical protein
MATLTTYAEVVTPDLVQSKMYRAGIKKSPPGLLFADLLKQTGGVFEFQIDMSPEFRENVLRAARLTSDEELLHFASLPKVPISLEHLRHLDPRTTRVVVGIRLTYAPGESQRLGLKHEGPYDPRNTILIDNTETN